MLIFIQKNNKTLVYPVEALISGEIYQLGIEGKSKPVLKNIQVRETCLVYLSQSEESSALWKNCPNKEPLPDNQDQMRAIEDFSVAADRGNDLLHDKK